MTPQQVLPGKALVMYEELLVGRNEKPREYIIEALKYNYQTCDSMGLVATDICEQLLNALTQLGISYEDIFKGVK